MVQPGTSPTPSPGLTILPRIVDQGLCESHPLRGAVLLLGNFDGFHVGHQALAAMARRIAPLRPVAVMACEPHPRAFFGCGAAPFRLATPATKAHMMATHGIDFIYAPRFDRSFAEMSPGDFVRRILIGALGVSHVIAGPDFRFGRQRAGDMAQLSALGEAGGFGVSAAPECTLDGIRVSSSRIRTAIRDGDLAAATRLLGRTWLVETRRNGTGGLELHPDLCRPRPGRYLGRLAGRSAGPRPLPLQITAEGGLRPLCPMPMPEASALWAIETQD